MIISAMCFEKDGKLMSYGDCPNPLYDCEGYVYQIDGEGPKDYRCTACQKLFSRNELNIREADDLEKRSYDAELEYKKNVKEDKTKAAQIISWWGFEMPNEFSVNHSPGGYLSYELYLSLVKKLFPDEQPLSESDFNELVWRIWR